MASIGRAHGLDLQGIAEGVETLEQLQCLRAHGCDQAQGYYIAKPLPVDELERLWRTSGGIVPGVAI